MNVAQNEWKRRRRERTSTVSISDDQSGWEDRLEHPSRNAAEQLEEREFQQGVEEQLQRLSQVERAVIVLYHQEERTYEQISLALGLPRERKGALAEYGCLLRGVRLDLASCPRPAALPGCPRKRIR